MSVYYTSEQLIDSVKRRITIPTNQNTYTDENILSFADEEMMLSIVPAIMSLHEDYLLFSEDTALVSNQYEYVIPYRAVGNKLYDLQFVDLNNNILAMSRTTLGEQPAYNGTFNAGNVYSYYVKNNRIGLLNGNAFLPSGSLRFIYYIRPSALVKTDEVCIIRDIDRNTGTITVNSIPDTFSTSTPCDFYNVRSPHNIISIDKLPTTVDPTSNSFIFDVADIPDELEVGDHLALAEQCAIPQIPSDLHVFLAQKTAERILEAQGDLEGLKMAQAKSAEMEVRAGTIIDNRVDESPLRLVNRNGVLRRGLSRRLYRSRG